jgi:hypothetical protein
MLVPPDFDLSQMKVWAKAFADGIRLGLWAAQKATALAKRLNTGPLIKWRKSAIRGIASGYRFIRNELMELDPIDDREKHYQTLAIRSVLAGLLLLTFYGYLMQLWFMLLDHWKLLQWQGLKDIAGAVFYGCGVSMVRRQQQNLQLKIRNA